MPRIDWFVGALVTFFLAISIWLFRVAFGVGDRKREREELRRSAKRAEAGREN
jgi:hypothetical protein